MKASARNRLQWKPAWSLVATCGLWIAAWSCAWADDLYPEDSVKAAFILRFASYVEWPDELPGDRNLVIAVLGSGAVAQSLQNQIGGRPLLNRTVQIRRISSIQNAGDARILYVGGDRRADLRILLASLAGRGVLVVTSENHALEAGSTINLLVADHRMRFEVSLEAARAANLRISSELLSLAARVQK